MARPFVAEALQLWREEDNSGCTCHAIEAAAWLATATGDYDNAHYLLAGTGTIRSARNIAGAAYEIARNAAEAVLRREHGPARPSTTTEADLEQLLTEAIAITAG
jgi:hypothetical protein